MDGYDEPVTLTLGRSEALVLFELLADARETNVQDEYGRCNSVSLTRPFRNAS
jgi:hypothetical protein